MYAKMYERSFSYRTEQNRTEQSIVIVSNGINECVVRNSKELFKINICFHCICDGLVFAYLVF